MLKEVVDIFITNRFLILPHNTWPHVMGHNPYKPMTQNTTWVAYRALTTP
jgi:hypothetical protein